LRKIGPPSKCFDHLVKDLEDEAAPLRFAVVRGYGPDYRSGPHCAVPMAGTVPVPLDWLDEGNASSLARAVAGQAKLAGLATPPGRTTELATTLAFVQFLGKPPPPASPRCTALSPPAALHVTATPPAPAAGA